MVTLQRAALVRQRPGVGAGEKDKQVDLNVLIVDDSAAIRKILVRVLSQTDLPIKNLHEANDGAEALKILEENEVSLVLSDINMPNVDGIELLTKIRATPKWKQLSVVMITTKVARQK